MTRDLDDAGVLSEEDVRQGKLVEQMRHHPGFAVLMEFWEYQREAIISAGKKAAKGDATDARYHWASLDGFDKAVAMIERIAQRAGESAEVEALEKEGSDLAQH